MIHTIHVDAQTEPEELRKLFRKKLMTGGAVLRLSPELKREDLVSIARTFLPGAEGHNVNSMVLAEVARSTELTDEVAAILATLPVEKVQRALKRRISSRTTTSFGLELPVPTRAPGAPLLE